MPLQLQGGSRGTLHRVSLQLWTFLEWDEPKSHIQTSAKDLLLRWRESGFCPSPSRFDWFCPYFAERGWCKNGLEQRLADRCALTEPQEEKTKNHIVPGSRALVSARWLFLKEKVPVWTGFGLWASPVHLALLNLSSARGGQDLKLGLGFITLRACTWKKGLDWFILQLCASQYFIRGSSAQAHHAQPVDAPAGLVARQSHLSAGADIQIWAFGQLTCA